MNQKKTLKKLVTNIALVTIVLLSFCGCKTVSSVPVPCYQFVPVSIDTFIRLNSCTGNVDLNTLSKPSIQ